MKPLDVITSVDFGYRLLWRERRYFLRLAAVPLLVKALCLLVLTGLGWEQHYLRMALVMLPAFFTEGWMLAHVTRLVFHNQRWPFRSSGDPAADEVMLLDRAYGVMLGTMFYVVIKFLMAGLAALMRTAQLAAEQDLATMAQAQEAAGPGFLAFLAAVGLLGVSAWAFRFIFLYIPAAAGLGTDIIVRTKQAMTMSMQLLGIWLVCFVPFMLVLAFVLSGLLPETPGQAIAPGARGILLILQVLAEAMIAIVATASVASGLRNMVEKTGGAR